jgi:hypothetical protein
MSIHLSFFNLILPIHLSHLTLGIHQTVSFSCQFIFLFLPLSLCLLLSLLPSLILALPILALHLFLDQFFLFSKVSADLEHLLIRLIHLNKVVRWPLIGNLHDLELLKDFLSILEGYFVRVNLFGRLVELLAEPLLSSCLDKLIDVHFWRLVFDFTLQAASLCITDEVPATQLSQQLKLLANLIALIELLPPYLFIKVLHHSKIYN